MVKDERLEGLAGVASADTHLRLAGTRLEQRGPLLVTHWGLSGPAVLRLSAWAARELNAGGYQADLKINWMPGAHLESMREWLGVYKSQNGRKQVAGHSALPEVPHRLWRSLALAAGVKEDLTWADLTRGTMLSLAGELTAGSYRISGKGEFKEEFVTCGGVALREVEFRRMESKLLPGLFLAGEVLDIDGITGGFNFQAAWTTGWIAGNSAADYLTGS
jgi:predicted Rossmann fold flavoprotein